MPSLSPQEIDLVVDGLRRALKVCIEEKEKNKREILFEVIAKLELYKYKILVINNNKTSGLNTLQKLLYANP